MSSGLTCITSNIPTFNILIKKANCGITLDFNGADSNLKKLIHFLKNSDNKLGQNGRDFVKKYHNWMDISNQYINLFKENIDRN
jgi:glycosyltransferase involved in cell wall biosynthesis